MLRTYDPRLIAECADMTLAAKERFGEKFFKTGPQAYFIDNLKATGRQEADAARLVAGTCARRRSDGRWQADREERGRNLTHVRGRFRRLSQDRGP